MKKLTCLFAFVAALAWGAIVAPQAEARHHRFGHRAMHAVKVGAHAVLHPVQTIKAVRAKHGCP